MNVLQEPLCKLRERFNLSNFKHLQFQPQNGKFILPLSRNPSRLGPVLGRKRASVSRPCLYEWALYPIVMKGIR